MPTFTVRNSDGQFTWHPIGDVRLNDNSLVEYEVDPVNKAVTVKCAVEDGYKSKLYQTEYDCVVAHSTTEVTPIDSAVSVDFTHYDTVVVSSAGGTSNVKLPVDSPGNPDGYWVAQINKVKPLKGCLDIIGGDRLRWEATGNGLSITDVSRPSLDCVDYVRVAGYIACIEDSLNELAAQLAAEPGTVVDEQEMYGLFMQYQSMRNLWNYLVIRNMIAFTSVYQGDTAYVQSRLTNNTGSDLHVGDIKIDFPTEGIPATGGERDLDATYVRYTFTQKNSSGPQPAFTMINGERQPMAGASFKLEGPEGGVTIPPGDSCELTVQFKVSATISANDPIAVDVQHRDTPWAGQWPTFSNGKIVKPGRLSYYNTHFNPTTYGSVTPASVPPVGDGCALRMAPGTATVAWNAQGLARCVLRPEVYIGLTCTADATTSDFTSNFSGVVDCNDTSEGTYSLSFTATTCSLMLTPASGGAAFEVLVITMTNRHFHEGDGIAVALPKTWSTAFAEAVQTGLNIPVECTWELPASEVLPSNSEAGSTKMLFIPPEAVDNNSMIKRIKLDSQMYKVDSVRGIDVYGQTVEV